MKFKERTREEYKEIMNQNKKEGETVIQMEEGDGRYFISNEGKIYSCYGGKVCERKPAAGYGRWHIINRKNYITLTINGKKHNYYIPALMRKYFNLETFNPCNETEIETHHKQPWDDSRTDNNRVDNLQVTGKNAHRAITAIQNGKLNDDLTISHKDPVHPFKQLTGVSTESGKPLMIVTERDPVTHEIISAQGYELPEHILQQINGMTFTGELQTSEEAEEQKRLYELLKEGKAEGTIIIKDGKLKQVKKGDNK